MMLYGFFCEYAAVLMLGGGKQGSRYMGLGGMVLMALWLEGSASTGGLNSLNSLFSLWVGVLRNDKTALGIKAVFLSGTGVLVFFFVSLPQVNILPRRYGWHFQTPQYVISKTNRNNKVSML